MANYLQADRYLSVTTPLGPDVLLLRNFRGREAISELFSFQLDLVAEVGTEVPFDKLLGKKVTAHVGPSYEPKRHFSGICRQFSEGARDASFSYYRMEMVPEFGFLKLRSQSRIFQQMTVPDILRSVLSGLQVVYRIRGEYHPRDYCVQYAETDFDFASRLMEEEGIFYFFAHDAKGHRLVIADTPQAHPPLEDSAPVVYERSVVGARRDGRITAWEKSQTIRPLLFTLRDHCFEIPHDPLAASKPISPSVMSGEVEHLLKLGPNERLEVYHYPGGYAQRFDGVDPGGGDRSDELGRIFEDNARTFEIRMQESAAAGLVISGEGHCRHLASGHWFTFARHFNADGDYIVVSVEHEATVGEEYRSSMGQGTTYKNRFECIPAAVPFRPARVTRRPVIHGTQTAVVVGPHGEEIFTDKYGRVKIQFHWDREGRHDARSSCWVRVGSPWADGSFGAVSIPRIGQEVIVAFEEGDPDRPVILGGVYNARNMPPFALPSQKMISGLRSNTYPGGGGKNELSFNDTKGSERMYIHAQYNQDTVVGNNRTTQVGVDSSESVGNNVTESVGNNKAVTVGVNESTTIGSNQSLSVGANATETVGAAKVIDVGSTLLIRAGTSITLQCGASTIHMNQAGFITISGTVVTMAGAVNANVAAPLTNVAGAVMLTCTGALNLVNGVVTRVEGSSLGHFGGGKAELVGGETLVQGDVVKIN